MSSESKINTDKQGYEVKAKSWRLKDLTTPDRELAVLEIDFWVKVGTEYIGHSDEFYISPKSLDMVVAKLRVLGWKGTSFAELVEGKNVKDNPGALPSQARAVFEQDPKYGLRIKYLNQVAPPPVIGAGSYLARLSAQVPDADKRNAKKEAERRAKRSGHEAPESAHAAPEPEYLGVSVDEIPF